MPKLCGLDLCSYIAFVAVLQVIGAIDLHAPSLAVTGGTVFISWTFQSSDPPTFYIYLDCGGNAIYEMVPRIPTNVKSATANMPLTINSPNSSFPLSCHLQALNSDGFNILDQVPIEVNINSHTSAGSRSSSTSIVASSTSPASSSLSSADLALSSPFSADLALSSPFSADPASSPLFSATTSPAGSSSSQVSTTSTSFHTNSASLSVLNSASSSSAPSGPMKTSASLTTTGSPDTSPSEQSSTSSTDTSPFQQSSTASSTQTSTHPIGAIIGGVVGGLVGLGILAIFMIFCLRQRRRASFIPLPPIPLPYNKNYVQPLDKTDYLARIADEREAVQQQRDQLQIEMERVHSRESTHSGTSETFSQSGLVEYRIEALSQRILELQTQQHELARQLQDGQSPPSYSNLSSAL